ncbi:Uncharacterised protein [Vibrio cholerae]|nr:Uncharacterised protein [Vibrio cholerae]
MARNLAWAALPCAVLGWTFRLFGFRTLPVSAFSTYFHYSIEKLIPLFGRMLLDVRPHCFTD